MGASGSAWGSSFYVAVPPEEAMRSYAGGLAGVGEFTFTTAGNTIVITRRYTPTWAIIVGIVGLLFFLIGVLAFFAKDTETLAISFAPSGDGAWVTISGVASYSIRWRIDQVTYALSTRTAIEGRDWYVARGAERLGPFTRGELSEWISTGRVGADELCWGPGLTAWIAAGALSA